MKKGALNLESLALPNPTKPIEQAINPETKPTEEISPGTTSDKKSMDDHSYSEIIWIIIRDSTL